MGTQLSRFLAVNDRLILAAHPPSLSERRFRANGSHTLCGADVHPCALNYRGLPAKVLVIQAGLARGGGWARLTPTVRPAQYVAINIMRNSEPGWDWRVFWVHGGIAFGIFVDSYVLGVNLASNASGQSRSFHCFSLD